MDTMFSKSSRFCDLASETPECLMGTRSGDFLGRLEAFSPFELLQFLYVSRKVGRATLSDLSGNTASCTMVHGGIMDPVCANLQDGEAALAMMGWKSGWLTFESLTSAPSCPAPINIPVLLMEAARLEDELCRYAPDLPACDTPLMLQSGAAEDPLGCGVSTVTAVLEEHPGLTLNDLETLVALAPVKAKLAVAWLNSQGYLLQPRESAANEKRQRKVLDDNWYLELLRKKNRGLRALMACSPNNATIPEAVASLAHELGTESTGFVMIPDGPSFVRLRPPIGGMVSITFLPLRKRHRYLFQTFASSADIVLISEDAPKNEVLGWVSGLAHSHIFLVHDEQSSHFLSATLQEFVRRGADQKQPVEDIQSYLLEE